MNIYQISNRLEFLMAKDELDEQECAELESLHSDHETACIDRGKYIKNMQAEIHGIEFEIENMEKRVRELSAEIEKQQGKLLNYMQQGNVTKIKSPFFDISITKSRPSVVVDSELDLPNEYWRMTETVKVARNVNKIMIKEAIESGKEVAGARLVTTLNVNLK